MGIYINTPEREKERVERKRFEAWADSKGPFAAKIFKEGKCYFDIWMTAVSETKPTPLKVDMIKRYRGDVWMNLGRMNFRVNLIPDQEDGDLVKFSELERLL